MEKLPVFFKNVNLKTVQFQNIKFQRSIPTNKINHKILDLEGY